MKTYTGRAYQTLWMDFELDEDDIGVFEETGDDGPTIEEVILEYLKDGWFEAVPEGAYVASLKVVES